MFHLGHLLVLPVTVIVVYILALAKERLRRAEQRRRLIYDHGCEPAPVEAQRSCLSGIDSLLESYKHKKRGTYLLHEQQCFKRYGNTYSTTRLGMEVLNTIDPENVERIMRSPKTFIARPIRKIPLGGLVGHGILTADGDVWKRQRTIMKPSFHHKRIGEFEMYEEHMHRLIANIPHDGRPIDLQELFFKFTIDTSTAHLFGESCRSLAGQSELSPDPEFAGAFDRAQRASVTKFALASVDWLRPQLQYWKDIRCIKRFADRYVKKALQQKHDEVIDPRKSKYDPKSRNRSSPNFLQSLTELTDDHDEIRTGLLNLLVGGRDTTASLLSNLWLSLSQDQRIWGKLCVEVASLEGVWPDVEALKRLPYLRQCIDESLRCHPAIPWSLRIAAEDTTLPIGGGPDRMSPIFVAKDTVVLTPYYCLHRIPEHWGDNADIFLPERWDTITPGWAYLPFSGGARKCLGWEFAINTASYVTIRIVQEFPNIESRDPRPWVEELGLSMTSKHGTYVALRR